MPAHATPKPLFFASPAAWRKWLAANHAREAELWVGFHKKASGQSSITWPESVDEALCFGWIDGVRKSIDDTRYTIRFTPRRPRSIWSAANVKRVADLIRQRRMRTAGLRAYQARTRERTAIYSFEQRKEPTLPPAFARQLKRNAPAWRFFSARPPWYRRTSTWWVISAKREATRQKRLAILIAHSAKQETIPPLTRQRGSAAS